MPPINSEFTLRRKPVIAWLLDSFASHAGPYSAILRLHPITAPVGMIEDDHRAGRHLLDRDDSVAAVMPAVPGTMMVEMIHSVCGDRELLGYIHPGFGDEGHKVFEQYFKSKQHTCLCIQMAELHDAEEDDKEEKPDNIDDFYLVDEEGEIATE